tara:strand:+ start:19 stop:306 length:288 start_codon:yes stop_codon:yes gene_type:complete
MNKKEIIDGYKGIMELDLTNIPEYLKKDTVEQHMKDIDNYKAEQYKLKPHLRYENTVERIKNTHRVALIKQQKRIDVEQEERRKHNEMYNISHNK